MDKKVIKVNIREFSRNTGYFVDYMLKNDIEIQLLHYNTVVAVVTEPDEFKDIKASEKTTREQLEKVKTGTYS